MFHVFAWERYQEEGGVDDLLGSYSTLEIAEKALKRYDEECSYIVRFQITDKNLNTIKRGLTRTDGSLKLY